MKRWRWSDLTLHNCRLAYIAIRVILEYHCGNYSVRECVHDIFNFLVRRNTMLFAPKEKGQGLVEYALILVLVAVVVIVILSLLGPAIGNIFSNIVGNI